MRLIDADLALEKIRVLEKEPDYQHEDEDWGVGLCMAEQAIDEVPTSAVVEQIFSDIENLLSTQEAQCENKRLADIGNWIFHEYLPTQLAELKKKYGVK